jgi:hypothetical protein
MPVVHIEDNIKQLRTKIEQMTQEMFRMQGVLQTFEGFKQGGLKTIDLPNDPNQDPVGLPNGVPNEELESTQEKPE